MNRARRGMLAAIAASSLVLAGTAIAHHGWSGYESEIRKLSGVIEQSSYTSPHGQIHLKTTDKTWVVVLAPPSRMTNRGLTEDMLKVGTNVSVEGYQNTRMQRKCVPSGSPSAARPSS